MTRRDGLKVRGGGESDAADLGPGNGGGPRLRGMPTFARRDARHANGLTAPVVAHPRCTAFDSPARL